MNMNNRKVYIIIPIYNDEKFLRKCLNSVFNQTYNNIKVICVNDGSTDNSLSILREYHSYVNLLIINQVNKGVGSARNSGLDLLDYNEDAFLTFIDSDDWVDENYIDTLVRQLESNNVDIVCSSFFLSNDNNTTIYKNIDFDIILDGFDATSILLKDETIQSHSCSKLFKLKLWKNIRFNNDLFYMEDQDVIYKTFYSSNKVFVTNYAGYYYRQDNHMAATKTAISNKKVVSGLKGYYSACCYQYKEEDKLKLIEDAQYGLAGAFLMLIPYYKKKKADEGDKQFIDELNKYIRTNRVIRKYNPYNKNARIKKHMYLICPPLYPFLFKMYKKIKK